MMPPDYTDPVIITGLLLVCVYAYMGGRWLDRRNKEHAEKLEKHDQEKRMENFK